MCGRCLRLLLFTAFSPFTHAQSPDYTKTWNWGLVLIWVHERGLGAVVGSFASRAHRRWKSAADVALKHCICCNACEAAAYMRKACSRNRSFRCTGRRGVFVRQTQRRHSRRSCTFRYNAAIDALAPAPQQLCGNQLQLPRGHEAACSALRACIKVRQRC